MSSPAPDGLETSIIFVGILVGVLVRRVYAQTQGTRYSATRLFAFAALALVLFGLLAATTLSLAVARWGATAWALVGADAAAALVAAALVIPYARRSARFEQRADGALYYRLPWLIPAVYLGLFVVRFGAEGYLTGFASLGSIPTGSSVSKEAVEGLIALDLLYGGSLGLLFGRGIGVVQAFRAFRPEPIT